MFNCAYKINRETEKAVALNAWGVNERTNKDVNFDYWVPKSIFTAEGKIPAWFANKKDESLYYDRDLLNVIIEVA